MESYVHVLLFRCPECTDAIVETITSDKQNPEEVDGGKLTLQCTCSFQKDGVSAATAIRHWVARWTI